MGSFYMEATQINYRRDETLKTVDQKLQELSETSAIDTDIAPVFKSTNTYAPGDMVYYRNKLYVFNVEHTGAWAAADVTATDVTTEISSLKSGLTNYQVQNDLNLEVPDRKNLLNYDAWKTVRVTAGSAVWENNGVTLTATGDCYTKYNNADFPVDARIPIKKGETITLSWEANNDLQGNVFIFPNGSTTGAVVVNNDTAKVLSYTATSGVTYVSYRFGVANAGETISYKNIQIEMGSTATSYAPYIPSVESRIEAVESGLTNVTNGVAITGLTLDQNVDGVIDDAKVFRFGKLIVGNIRITLNAALVASMPLIHGLPKMNTTLAAFSGLCPAVTNKASVVCVVFNESVVEQASLSLASGVSVDAGVFMVSFTYVSV